MVNWFFTKEKRRYNKEKIGFSINGGETGHLHRNNYKNLDTDFMPFTNSFKLDEQSKCKMQNHNVPRR